MRIGIDGYLLSAPFPCGTKRYAEGLIRALQEIDKKNDYFLYVHKKNCGVRETKNFHIRLIPSFKIGKRQIFLPYMIKKDSLDVFHNLDPYGSITNPCDNIVTTVHDVYLHRMLSNNFSFSNVVQRFYMSILRNGVFKKTTGFICVSKQVKDEVVKAFPVKSRNITFSIIYYGLHKQFFSRRTGHRNGIITFHDFSKKKNVLSTIQAYASLSPCLHAKHDLHIVVSSPLLIPNIQKMIEKKKIVKFVKIHTRLSLVEMARLYRSCLCLVYPSLYEGFGMPIIEAMASGCLVITTGYGATREAGGNVPEYIDPSDPVSIRNALLRTIMDTKMQKIRRRRGWNRASAFDWLKTAHLTLKTYERIFNDFYG